MMRVYMAFALLALLFGSLGGATALAAPVDQGSWSSLKKEVRLPSGLRMAYVELGDPQGEPLLLLHGYTDSSRTWSLIVPYLGDYRLLIPDQRGHGASDAPACCYAMSVFADDARLFMDAMGIQRAAIAGHSMGSMVAITMAAEYPDRVSKVVLIGSTALAPVKRGDWLWSNSQSLRFPVDRKAQFYRDWHPGNQPTPVDQAFAEAAVEEVFATAPHVWKAVIRELADVPIGRHTADIRAPVLILSGGRDSLFPAEHHESLLKAFPGAEAHVFAELGHNPLWERPQELGLVIGRFLAAPFN